MRVGPGRFLGVLAAWLCAASPLWANEAGTDGSMRESLARQRQAIESQHAARERECAQRFVVTGCLEEARSARRKALSELGAREASLDDAERSQRAAARLQRIDEKVARQASEGRASAPLLPMDSPASSVRSARPPLSDSAPIPTKSREPKPEIDPAQRRLQEQQARSDREGREEALKARRQAATDREAKRQQAGKPLAAPLPPPAAASKAR